MSIEFRLAELVNFQLTSSSAKRSCSKLWKSRTSENASDLCLRGRRAGEDRQPTYPPDAFE